EGRAIGRGGAGLPRPYDRADLAVAIDDSQRVPAPLQDVNVALGVGGNGARIDERRFAGRSAVGRHAALAVSGNKADDARAHIDGADAAVVEVDEIQRPADGREGDAI